MHRRRGSLLIAGVCVVVAALAAAIARSGAAPARIVSLSRTVCFGMCPVYEVTLYEDGTLEYEGKEYVRVVGRKTTTINRATIAKVTQAIVASGIQKLGAHCCDCQEMTDHPSAVIGFQSDGRWTTIVDDHGCTKTPPAVRELEETLDTLLGTERFIGTLEERQKDWSRRPR
jgi:Domain of unknown function (DUF6438)